MFYVIKLLYGMIAKLYAENADTRVKDWPLVYSPLPAVSLVALYLLFVLHYGPKWMEKRQPFQLKMIMRVYNAVQVLANLFLFVTGVPSSYGRKDFSWSCQPVLPMNTEPWMMRVLKITYGYYLTKYLDLFDTIFIVLRKKNQQVTFLHVYHHAGMVIGVYIYMTFLPGSHCTMLGIINLLVHTVMYSYYFVASVRPSAATVWWKRYITQLQLAQFAYLVFHFLQVVLNNHCGYPLLVAITGFMQNIFMFFMFFEFYYRTYIKGGKSKAKPQQIDESKEKLKSS
ncbi:very long chain fatty acid elongase 7-like [Haematobia irritans]|uniref:very long chain fatty acid elongase 7-like n=1 Tax=Haematobia irritans TaxID=7368 RepID=UPI003F501348